MVNDQAAPFERVDRSVIVIETWVIAGRLNDDLIDRYDRMSLDIKVSRSLKTWPVELASDKRNEFRAA